MFILEKTGVQWEITKVIDNFLTCPALVWNTLSDERQLAGPSERDSGDTINHSAVRAVLVIVKCHLGEIS